MANYTAKDIKDLREATGAGMLDVKKALDEAEGSKEKAIEILRLKGLKGAEKRQGRSTENGLCVSRHKDGKALLLELLCETDFVAKSQNFIDLSEKIADIAFDNDLDTKEKLLDAEVNGEKVADLITSASAAVGEKIEIGKMAFLSADKFSVYMHKTNPDLPYQLGVLFGYESSLDAAETAHSIAQHISFADPKYLFIEDVDADILEKEKSIIEKATLAEGKPEAAVPKIIEGRINAFYKTIVLHEQQYAKDNKKVIKDVFKEASIRPINFIRIKVGE